MHVNGLPSMLKQSEISHSEDMSKSDEDDNDVTIFMDVQLFLKLLISRIIQQVKP